MEARPILPEGLHGRLMFVGRVSISAPITSRTGGNFVSRPKFRPPFEIPSRARSSFLRPSLLYFLLFGIFCRGDVVATVYNNTRRFGMTGSFSRKKGRKSDHDGERLGALPGV
jgi:hypothetical protein